VALNLASPFYPFNVTKFQGRGMKNKNVTPARNNGLQSLSPRYRELLTEMKGFSPRNLAEREFQSDLLNLVLQIHITYGTLFGCTAICSSRCDSLRVIDRIEILATESRLIGHPG
jgi:hypothetical protein